MLQITPPSPPLVFHFVGRFGLIGYLQYLRDFVTPATYFHERPLSNLSELLTLREKLRNFYLVYPQHPDEHMAIDLVSPHQFYSKFIRTLACGIHTISSANLLDHSTRCVAAAFLLLGVLLWPIGVYALLSHLIWVGHCHRRDSIHDSLLPTVVWYLLCSYLTKFATRSLVHIQKPLASLGNPQLVISFLMMIPLGCFCHRAVFFLCFWESAPGGSFGMFVHCSVG